MTSNYTITFSEFLELYENTDEWLKVKAKVQLINSNLLKCNKSFSLVILGKELVVPIL